MREIGGYLEMERFGFDMPHEGALALNTGRNCLKYIIQKRNIQNIYLPIFNCDVVENACMQCGVNIKRYSVDESFRPVINDTLADDEWVYIVNFYGQLSRETMSSLKDRYKRVIFDQAHAFFEPPVPDCDNIYTCRKFFGVPDGAFLYTDIMDGPCELEQDSSWDEMKYILGRFENTASQFYEDYRSHEDSLASAPLKLMSKLTRNLLRGIDLEKCRGIRETNYGILHELLKDINMLDLTKPAGPYMYPLMINDAGRIREYLLDRKIYVPILWPNVTDTCERGSWDHRLASSVLPLPCDQRYNDEDMRYIVTTIKEALNL